MTRSTRIAVWILGGIAGLLVLLLAIAIAARLYVTTDAGRRWLVSQIEKAASSPEQSLEIGALNGDPFSAFQLADVRLGDADGQWLDVRSVDAEWSPWSLIGRKLKVEKLLVDGVSLSRLPAGGEEEEEPKPSTLPELPVDIVVDRFEFRDVAVAEAAVGMDAVLGAEGNVSLVRGEGYSLRFSGRRTDREDGTLDATVRFLPDEDVLEADVSMDAPANGFVTNLLKVPGRPALSLAVTGEGPLSAWNGQVSFRAGDRSVVDLQVAASRTERTDLEIMGQIDPRPFASVPMLDAAFDVSGRLHFQGESVEIESLALDSAPSSFRLFGTVDAGRSAMDLIFQVRPQDLERLNQLVAPASLGETAVDGRLSGPFDNPNLSLNILSDGVEMSGAGASGLFLTIMAHQEDGDFVISGTGGMNALHYEDTAISGMPALLLDARLPADFSGVELERAELRATDGDISASGTVSFSGGPLDLKVEADIPADGGRGESMIAKLLAPGVQASASVAQQNAESPLAISDISVNHPWVTLTGNAGFGQGEGAELGQFDVHVTDVAALAGAVGAPLSGDDVTVTATVANSWAQPRLDARVTSRRLVAGSAELDNLQLDLDNRPTDAGGQEGRMTLSALSPLGDTRLAVDYAVPGEGPIRLSTISLDTPEGGLTGGFTVPRDDTPITGSLSGRISAGPELQEMGVPLEGDVDLALELKDVIGTQVVALTVGGNDVTVGPVEQASLSAELLRTADNIDFTVTANGQYHGNAQLTTEGSFSSSGDRQNLLMRTFNLQAGAHTVRLQQPVRVTRLPERVEIEPLTLALDDGSLDVSLQQRAGQLDLNLEFTAVPLDLTQLADIPVAVGGRLNGSVDFQAEGQTASGTVALRLADLNMRGGAAQVTGLGGNIDGTWNGEQLSLTSRITGGDDRRIEVAGTLPLVYQPSTGGAELPPDGPLDLKATWQAEMAPLWPAIGSDDDFLSGQLSADVSVAGTVAAPEMNGQLRLRGGSYRNVSFGTRLSDLTADVTLTPGHATIENVSAVGPKGGTFSASGTADFPTGGLPAVDMTVAFDKLQALDRPDVTARVSGEVNYTLNDNKSLLSGMVTTNNVEARLIAPASSDVVSLDVTEVPAPRHTTAVVEAPEETAPPMQLDIQVDIPQELFIRGRGLDSEWKGDLHVAGPADAFTITGNVNIIRGNFSFAGKRFALTKGDVRFNGNHPINPDVDIVAEYETTNLTAMVNIGGTAQNIEISFSSNPAMPEDEILSNILFEKGVNNLSALEAVQLAAAMRSLATGGSGGLMGSARSALGLDVLSFGSSDAGDGTVVRGGKYITKNVYVEVQSGTEPGSERVGVEVEVTRNLSVESHVVETTGGDIGLYWKKDY